MKRNVIYLGIILFLLIACHKKAQKVIVPKKIITCLDSKITQNAIVYQVNIKNYSAEGSFNAFAKDIPKLKAIGIKIIWLMPVQEMGHFKRNITNITTPKKIEDTVTKQILKGNPYVIKNYKKIDPNYGSDTDLKKIIKTAHTNGMYVVLDWVANHTAWNHDWITSHPDFYLKNKKEILLTPYHWINVAKLNYTSSDLHFTMINEMKYWIQQFDIDGFRCQVASEVPTFFWERAVKELRKIKPILMIAEAEKESLLKNAFDIQYAWEAHHILNSIAQSKMNVLDLDRYLEKEENNFPKDKMRLHFITNYDENIWNGTEYKRMGQAVEVMTVLTYILNGIPLIYNGQEYDSHKQFPPYKKDTLLHTEGRMMPIYKKLGTLKKAYPFLNTGKESATSIRIHTNNDRVFWMCKREKKNRKLFFIANLSSEKQNFKWPITGCFKDFFENKLIEIKNTSASTFQPWQYKILISP
ncbi:alpha-amlyase [Flavobacterium columnare]|uniref:Alpha-amlyase n=1 Tax=Flavobacterium columnare TaxID=996 RepID=A0A437UCI4_9FLAO|nr:MULTISPECIES: alpha-amylase family glycosyl hydrolase [Flavobacterium]QYS89827.1 alpha-amylase [Flavobacterium davisii]RVU91323.1 alpha-amlyase [Flavobacterium columnare]